MRYFDLLTQAELPNIFYTCIRNLNNLSNIYKWKYSYLVSHSIVLTIFVLFIPIVPKLYVNTIMIIQFKYKLLQLVTTNRTKRLIMLIRYILHIKNTNVHHVEPIKPNPTWHSITSVWFFWLVILNILWIVST